MKDSQKLTKKPRKFRNIHGEKKVVILKESPKKAQVDGKNKKSLTFPEIKFSFSFFKYFKILCFVTLLVLPVILLIILILIQFRSNQTENQIKMLSLAPLEYSIKLSPYPLLNSFIQPNITAQSAIIIDADSRVVLFAKNTYIRLSLASTTKLMTALVGLDYYRDNSILTINTPKVEGSNLGFFSGEQFLFKNLLYAMFLPSSNEAAYAVAENYPGGKDVFVQKMNEKAREIGLVNTHFNDPAGLDDDNNYSTAGDLANMASFIIKNPVIAEVAATKEINISDISNRYKIHLENLNKLLGHEGVNGVKTGTTEGAGEVLVTSKLENGHTYVIVVMKSKDRFADTKSLLSLINNNIHYVVPQVPEALNTSINPMPLTK